MSVNENIRLINETLAADKVSGAVGLPQKASIYVAYLKLSNNAGATVAGDLEHSLDGENWFILHSFTGLSSDDVEISDLTGVIYSQIRANLTVSGGSGDVDCRICFDPGRGK